MNYADVLEKFYSLRRDKQGEYERPHKPLLLLTIIDLIEAGLDSDNRFPIDDTLFKIWKSYFEIVKRGNDKPTVENPLYYLSGDNIWGLVARDGGGDLYQVSGSSITPSKRWLQENAQFGQLDPELYNLLSGPRYLSHLRKAIIGRYFPDHLHTICELSKNTVAALSGGSTATQIHDDEAEPIAARDRAFRKLVLSLYDNRCAACGLRLIVGEAVVVDAAHIVPWSESQNDHPANGIALCKNHHWAMDRGILAPGVDRKWHVSQRLDSRIRDHRPIIELNNQSLFEPSEKKFRPKESYLRWRQERLS